MCFANEKAMKLYNMFIVLDNSKQKNKKAKNKRNNGTAEEQK